MPTTPPSILGTEDVHTMPLAFLPPSAMISANMATPSFQDAIMPLTKSHFQHQHPPLLQNGSTVLCHGAATTPQQDLQSTVVTHGPIVMTSPEQFSSTDSIGATSLSSPNHGYSRLQQVHPTLHCHSCANDQSPPFAHVISQQQPQQHLLQHQQLQGLASLPPHLNAIALQSRLLS